MEYNQNRETVKAKYPDASLYVKNKYCYVTSKDFPGFTIGSGATVTEAWKMAYEVVMEGEEIK